MSNSMLQEAFASVTKIDQLLEDEVGNTSTIYEMNEENSEITIGGGSRRTKKEMVGQGTSPMNFSTMMTPRINAMSPRI
jgi:hypothetical protein